MHMHDLLVKPKAMVCHFQQTTFILVGPVFVELLYFNS